MLSHGWKEFYGDVAKETTTTSSIVERPSLSGNMYVVDCKFEGQTAGCIRFTVTSDSVCVLIETSSFKSCSSGTKQGSSIYFVGDKGQIISNRVCGTQNSLSNTANGVFSYTYAGKSSSKKNHLIFSSVSKCGIDINTGWSPLYHTRGQISIQNSNISDNKSASYSAYVCQCSYGYFCIEFCSFRNNYNSNNYLTYHNNEGNIEKENIIKMCNFIGNPSCVQAVLYSQSSILLDSCSIIDNIASNTFYINSGTTTVSNSYLKDKSKTGNGAIQFVSEVLSYSIVPLYQQVSGHCIIVILKPIIQYKK